MTNTVNDMKQVHRSDSDKMVAGVCGGWAEYLGVDPTVLRIGAVAATVLTGGAPVLIYAAGWALTPEKRAAEQAEAATTDAE